MKLYLAQFYTSFCTYNNIILKKKNKKKTKNYPLKIN